MKQSLVTFTLSIFLSLTTQHAFAMDYLGQLAGQGFSCSMQALEFALPIAIPAYMVYQDRQDFVTHARPVDPKTEEFVREQLLAGYPELADAKIKVVKIPNSCFVAAIYNDTAYISIPEILDAEELAKAQQLEAQNSSRFTQEELTEKSAKNKLEVPAFVAKAKNSGFAMDASTLNTWRGILLHEGSHLYHKDSRTRIALLGVSVLVALYATKKIKDYLDVSTIASDPTFTNLIVEGLAQIPSLIGKISLTGLMNAAWTYWQEYRADQDSIARAQDVNILKARGEFFESLPDTSHTLEHVIKDIMDPHPSNTTRAAYFNKAAQEREADKKTK